MRPPERSEGLTIPGLTSRIPSDGGGLPPEDDVQTVDWCLQSGLDHELGTARASGIALDRPPGAGAALLLGQEGHDGGLPGRGVFWSKRGEEGVGIASPLGSS